MPTQFTSEVATASGRDSPVAFTSAAALDSQRDFVNLNYYGEREPMYSSRGKQPLTLENGNGIRLENDEYLLLEGEWPAFTSEVSTASSRD